MPSIQITGFTASYIADLMNDAKQPNVKKFFITDSDGSPTNIFIAQAAAISGEPCLEQQLAYVTVSGVKALQKIAWRNAVWSGTLWDIED